MTPLRSHRYALAVYAGMYRDHVYATLPLGRLLDTAEQTIVDARWCFRCGGRGGKRDHNRWWVPCENCNALGYVLETRSLLKAAGGAEW